MSLLATTPIVSFVAAATSWVDAVRDQPVKAVLSITALGICSVTAGFALRALTRRTRSLRHLVVAILLAALAVGAVAAYLLAQLMIVDGRDARTIVGVLVVTAVFASVLGDHRHRSARSRRRARRSGGPAPRDR